MNLSQLKKQLGRLAFGIIFLIPGFGISQNTPIIPCYTDEAMKEYFDTNPAEKLKFEQSQAILQKQSDENEIQNLNNKAAAVQYTIPVVFHILHMGGSENIPDADVHYAMSFINKDYEATNTDANNVAAPFQSLYINSDVKFMLAKKDPNGNCTSGIVRHVDARTSWTSGIVPSGITWNPTKYLNIIVVKSIAATSTVAGGGTIVGYSQYPGSVPTGSDRDVIIYTSSFIGSDPRAIGHEVGHWLNLQHIWGNSNNPLAACGNDGVSDTPLTKGALYNCPSSLTGNVCNAAGTDNVENIMNYSSCRKNFTAGQTNRLRTAAAAATGGRSNVISAANLIFTDVNGTGMCAPVAEFLPTNNSFTVCAGSSLTMKDLSSNGTVTAYQWAANNSANVISPSNSITVINFPIAGISSVSLTVSNAQGNSTKVRNVTVLNSTVGLNAPVLEGFEGTGLPVNWSVNNGNGGTVTWAQTNLGAYEGINSYYLNGNASGVNQEDDLVTPIMDLQNNPGAAFTFQYAYARQTSSHNDELKIQGSKDCGATWQDIYVMSAAYMANGSGGTSSAAYIPSAEQWKFYDLSLHPNWNNYVNSPAVKLRFKFKAAGFGNNLYLDAINLSVPTGVNELSKAILFSLYPNPSNGEVTLSFRLSDAAIVQARVLDLLGKEVEDTQEYKFSNGEQNISINQNETLSKGIYIVELTVNGARLCKKFSVN